MEKKQTIQRVEDRVRKQHRFKQKIEKKKRENTKATTFKNIIVGNFLKHINDNYKQFQEAQKPRQEK